MEGTRETDSPLEERRFEPPVPLRLRGDGKFVGSCSVRIVGNSVGAAVLGAILNFGINRRIPEAGDAVNHLLEPAARHGLGAAEIARLSEAVAGSLHIVYVVAGLVAVVSLFLALALPARLSPTRPLTRL